MGKKEVMLDLDYEVNRLLRWSRAFTESNPGEELGPEDVKNMTDENKYDILALGMSLGWYGKDPYGLVAEKILRNLYPGVLKSYEKNKGDGKYV